ncbi:hypothetical protein GCK72_022165 [Caenorhabditis remanei]|uniref:Uncharacterized protein n=2 Tax=Caenorhabditis remanei TaxID=31234 RepID=E3MAB5_CAERE|nr:hypothetical protein GCK72_022165 [Caenorhabditis remanei]EFO96807.1 hypothetical protein CRE_17139 [Caenorhabditis remanei]KAF1745718.1 hypothetical protein GCK72_022165 [Caenorhabditis remanei]
MIRATALFVVFFAIAVNSEIYDKNSEQSGIQETANFALAVKDQDLRTDLAVEGQSSDVVIRAKRQYCGYGCGCGCATVAAVTPVPCGYGCCGCG